MFTRKRLAVAVCGLLAILGTGLPAPAAAGEPARGKPKVELVLDVSGSMRARDIDGGSRMAAAQQAFNDVLDAVPEDVLLGIRTLGATYPGDDRAVGCRDSRQLYPVGTVDRTEAKAAVATLRPTGWTPIGLALRKADRDLRGDATRRIVLITDGEDSCGRPDPCDVARELAAQGTHLVVDTLGLTLDRKVREQLSCIAEATGGTYTAVRHTGQLTKRIKQLVRRTADAPAQASTPVEGTDGRCADAPVLGAGTYSDRAEFGRHRRYQVMVRPGQELRASVSVSADRDINPDYGVLLRAFSRRGRELVRGSEAAGGRTDVLSTGLRYPFPGDDPAAGGTAPGEAGTQGSGTEENAVPARPVCLEVGNSFSVPPGVRRTPGLPLELTVDLVAAADEPGDIAAFGLGRGWVLLVVLTAAGLVVGLLAGWLARWRVTVWRTN